MIRVHTIADILARMTVVGVMTIGVIDMMTGTEIMIEGQYPDVVL